MFSSSLQSPEPCLHSSENIFLKWLSWCITLFSQKYSFSIDLLRFVRLLSEKNVRKRSLPNLNNSFDSESTLAAIYIGLGTICRNILIVLQSSKDEEMSSSFIKNIKTREKKVSYKVLMKFSISTQKFLFCDFWGQMKWSNYSTKN